MIGAKVERTPCGKGAPCRTKPSEGKRWGTLRLTTTGRRTHGKRSMIIAYLEDGPNLIAVAMNGWADGEPAWWLNLQAHPDASVVSSTGHARCGLAWPRGTNDRACGADGARSTRNWTPMQRSGRPRPQW
jgi:deazaflavin-dependent oxidoreductase (nitroreductase family)